MFEKEKARIKALVDAVGGREKATKLLTKCSKQLGYSAEKVSPMGHYLSEFYVDKDTGSCGYYSMSHSEEDAVLNLAEKITFGEYFILMRDRAETAERRANELLDKNRELQQKLLDLESSVKKFSSAFSAGFGVHATTKKCFAHASTRGEHSIAASLGFYGYAKVSDDTGWLILVEYDDNNEIVDIHRAKPGMQIKGVTIEKDTWYSFVKGVLVSKKEGEEK